MTTKQKIIRILMTLGLGGLFGISFLLHKMSLLAADPKKAKICPPLIPNQEEFDGPTAADLADGEVDIQFSQRGGTINDASCLNSTGVYGIVEVETEDDVKNALAFAKQENVPLSISAVRHSMGGQAFSKGAIVMDMMKFNEITINEEAMTMTVQPGATWHQIQNELHPKYAVLAMQSSDIFSVGGSISVNAHGMDHHAGAVANTLKSLRVLKPDGEIVTASREENQELFNQVVGGYGLFGVILEAEIAITTNDLYERDRRVIKTEEFIDTFHEQFGDSQDYGLFYAHMSTSPSSLLEEMILYGYKKVEAEDAEIPPLEEVENVGIRRLTLAMAKRSKMLARFKWWAEKKIEPKLEACSVNRNQAMSEGESCLVSRNEPMHDSVKYLLNDFPEETDILHEYFIPRDQFIPFVNGMKEIFKENDAKVLNVSVRVVHKEENVLNYAPQDAFSIVLYLNQETDDAGNAHMKEVTQQLIDLTSSVGGRFFLPYQLHYSSAQLEQAYPNINDFFTQKKEADPDEIFVNTWYQKYKEGEVL